MIKKYPYTDFNEYNLDWIISQIKKMHADWDDFKVLNTIRFEGIWDITKQYPAWTLVTDDNVGYISVKPVPSGIDISNNDYWREVYNYSTIIPDIMQRIIDLESRVSTDEDDISLIKNRKVLIIGDSYNTGTGGGQNIPTMKSSIAYRMGLDLDDIYVYAAGGAGFVRNADDVGESFENVLNTAIAGMSDDEKESITDIFIIGGANDGGASYATLNANIERFNTIAVNNYPNAKIKLFAVGWSYVIANRINLLTTYNYYDMCHYPVYRLYYVLQRKSYMHDTYHPNQAGVEMLGRAIGSIGAGIPFDYNALQTGEIYLGDGTTSLGFYTWYDQNNVYIKLSSFPVASVTGQSFAYTRAKIGEGSFPLCYGYRDEDPGSVDFPVWCLMRNTSSQFSNGTLLFALRRASDPLTDTTMDIYVRSLNSENNALKTYSNINTIYFDGSTITIPIQYA